jgi:type IV pilus assembly protein PilP
MKRPVTHERQLRAAVMVAVCGLLGACASGTGDLQNYVTEVKSRPGPPLDPLPVMQQFEQFEYAANALRDPFMMPKQERTGSGDGPRPDPNRRRELLEGFPLDGLSMVGTLGADANAVALVLDPDRVVHRVRVGNFMGQNEGRIVRIAEDRIDLIELVPDGTGGWMERQASIALD